MPEPISHLPIARSRCSRRAIPIALLQIAALLVAALFLAQCSKRQGENPGGENYDGWRVVGGTPDNIHYSALKQINRGNVSQLKVAWKYDTGDAFKDSEMECNPIVVNGVLYAVSPKLRVFALNAATGKLIWSFSPPEAEPVLHAMHFRGLTYWSDGNDTRIFYVFGHNLYALNAKTGQPVPSFGQEGHIDLRQGLGRNPEDLSVKVTSPGAIYKDLIIMGSSLPEDLPCPPGDIRAYDVRSGQMRWSFHTIPRPGEPGYETWPKDAWKYTGGANNWAGLTVDARRGLVFVPTGSAAFDFYGSDRVGDDLYANCLLALDANTGRLAWYFQAVKHDLWDRDFPSAPALVTVEHDRQRADAVAQTTKSGYVFVFNRETGKPLFPIEYRKAPASDVDGEKTAETQAFPLLPPPFAEQQFTPEMLTNRTPAAHKAVLAQLRKLRYGGQFIPPSRQGTVIFPGFDGGGEWGGPAFDPATGLLYVNANVMAWILRLVPRPRTLGLVSGRELYLSQCSSCHKANLAGSPPEFPSLKNIAKKYNESQVADIIRKGGGRMPAFAQMGKRAIEAIATYLVTGKQTMAKAAWDEAEMGPWLKYMSDGYNKFLDPDGYPAVKPPWGTLTAIDLNTGKFVWRIPFGEFPELVKEGIHNTGSENYGGPLVTAGGLLFIAATDHDNKFHAFDKATGKLLWEATLPFAGNATPAAYEVGGQQYLVIGAGGGKWGAASGGTYVAYALPK
ncbi:MAG TPA: PQQ-binding-like beta-propeller repeat protein [Terriglobia bacterium]|nr:PQQ-binding-like beta-propeller repeat protein [Terriglobia bacterium]